MCWRRKGLKFIKINDPVFATLHDVEDLYNKVMEPFYLSMPDGKELHKIKRMIEDIDCPSNEFMEQLFYYLMEIGCPVFKGRDVPEWFNTLTQYKLKEAHLKNISMKSEGGDVVK